MIDIECFVNTVQRGVLALQRTGIDVVILVCADDKAHLLQSIVILKADAQLVLIFFQPVNLKGVAGCSRFLRSFF